VLPEMQEKFANTYRSAGGSCDYRLFENAVHEWVAEPGPQTDKAREVAKEFIARQLKV
jgi:acetyl esterase/lipase